jgi:nicotinamidase-related amidase
MTSPSDNLDLQETALLLLDFQNDILDRNLSPAGRKSLLTRVGRVLDGARRTGLPVVHVVAQFRPGYPEISPRDVWRRDIQKSGRLREGSHGAKIVDELAPESGDITVVKRRTGPFSTTDLGAVLSAQGIHQLILAGISTGGTVLSAVRAAADLDYSIVVLDNCCADPDAEVHRVLCEKVFPRQARVMAAGQFIGAVGWDHAAD